MIPSDLQDPNWLYLAVNSPPPLLPFPLTQPHAHIHHLSLFVLSFIILTGYGTRFWHPSGFRPVLCFLSIHVCNCICASNLLFWINKNIYLILGKLRCKVPAVYHNWPECSENTDKPRELSTRISRKTIVLENNFILIANIPKTTVKLHHSNSRANFGLKVTKATHHVTLMTQSHWLQRGNSRFTMK